MNEHLTSGDVWTGQAVTEANVFEKICMFWPTRDGRDVRTYVCMYVYVICMYVRSMYVCVLCIYVCRYIRTYVRTYLRTYV